MARKRKAAARGTRLDIVKRSIAIAEVFRRSEGKHPFTIKTLTAALQKGFPHLFPGGHAPDESTITRAVDALADVLPITRSTARKAGMTIEGSPKQVVWTYTPGITAARSIESLSDHKERIDHLISLAVAVEALAPVEGLPLYDSLVALKDSIEKHTVGTRDRQASKRTTAKYSVGERRKRRGTLRENQIRGLLRTIDRCVTENRRLKIRHKSQYGQREEPEYVLEPHAIRTRNGSVYIYAHVVSPERDHLHQFKLDRITSAEALSQLNQLNFDVDTLDDILATTISNYLPPKGDPQAFDIQILVDKRLANWVIEEKIYPQQKTPETIILPDGTKALKVTIEKAYMNNIVPRILGLGEFVKVVSPPELIHRVHGRLAAAAQLYESETMRDAGEGLKPPVPKRSAAHKLEATGSSLRHGSANSPKTTRS